jgi:ABC-2 type transport system permease protein
VRRELWENRSLYIAPLIVAAVELLAFAFSIIGQAERRRAALLLDPLKRRHAIEQPYDVTAMMMLLTMFVVGLFYCLDALHGERRDRSILFWKSLPVSDLTTALSKLTIPVVLLPLLCFAVTVCTHIIMFLMSSVVLLVGGVSPATTWQNVPFIQDSVVLIYGLFVLAFWHVPLYSWFLLVSAWARRATFLWAVLPFCAIGIFEKITFGTSYFGSFIKYRFTSFAAEAFDFRGQQHPTVDTLAQLTPGRYLTAPGLWLGLLFAAACITGAVHLRRSRGPI